MEDEYDIKTLDCLAARCGLRKWQGKACAMANIATANPAKWRNGREPMPSKFRRFRTAVIDMAIDGGALPPDCHHLTMAELIELAKEWRV